MRVAVLLVVVLAGLLYAYLEFRWAPSKTAELRELEVAASQSEVRVAHVSASSTVGKGLRDAEFGVSLPSGAVRGRRFVQYCQWVERAQTAGRELHMSPQCEGAPHCLHTLDAAMCSMTIGCYWNPGGVVPANQPHYRYEVQWTHRPVNSRLFRMPHFVNPVQLDLPEIDLDSEVAFSDGTRASAAHLETLLESAGLRFTSDDYEGLKASPAFQKGFALMDSTHIIFDYSKYSSEHAWLKAALALTRFVRDGVIDLAGPSLCTPGDMRVSYTVWKLPSDPRMTVIAKLAPDNSYVPYKLSTGTDIFFVRPGFKTLVEVLVDEHNSVTKWLWIGRVFTFAILAVCAWFTFPDNKKSK